MNSEDFKGMVETIIKYIPLVYPGIISVAVYNFCNAVSSKDIRLFLIKSICIGYVYDLVLKKWWFATSGNDLWYNAILCLISILLPIILYKIVHSESIESVLDNLDIRTSIVDNEIEIMCSGQEYNYVRLYLKNKPVIYEGYVRYYDKEYNRKQYIILNDYKIVYYQDSPVYKEEKVIEHNDYEEDKLLVYMEDVYSIEKHSYKRIRELS